MSRVNVVPENDLDEHIEEVWCPCKPVMKEDVLVHNSFDGREHREADHDQRNCGACIDRLAKILRKADDYGN